MNNFRLIKICYAGFEKSPGQNGKENNPPGDPIYGPEEDIYNNAEKEQLKEDKTNPLEDELDVPGAELDDENEQIGEEDEENNYYSLGGDNHENLEEDRS